MLFYLLITTNFIIFAPKINYFDYKGIKIILKIETKINILTIIKTKIWQKLYFKTKKEAVAAKEERLSIHNWEDILNRKT